ncbi:hypothetical protein ACFO0N_02880 [Halobium salinum]|uniref:Uncharacterized protein n=1 Tax=Halobium salinum TaxID=1364940 RepID=A0ABD5P893_9EURY|nr:hypothetical protein [Halobium salinum]
MAVEHDERLDWEAERGDSAAHGGDTRLMVPAVERVLGVVPMASRWTKFQTDCLLAVVELESESAPGLTGQEVERRLEAEYGYEVGQGRLYTNLDRLATERYWRRFRSRGGRTHTD